MLWTYRCAVFGLALFYWLEQFQRIGGAGFGWHFRYLTIWGLTLSLISAVLMVRYMAGRARAPLVIASVTAVVNALVLLLYWRLYLIDPILVNGEGPIPAWREYYLHGAGPVLQIIDAVFLLGAFRRPLATLAGLVAVIASFLLWIELVVQPLNDAPLGRVTSGLPYPFLNDMELVARLEFYATTALTALVFWGIGVGVTRARERLLGPLV